MFLAIKAALEVKDLASVTLDLKFVEVSRLGRGPFSHGLKSPTTSTAMNFISGNKIVNTGRLKCTGRYWSLLHVLPAVALQSLLYSCTTVLCTLARLDRVPPQFTGVHKYLTTLRTVIPWVTNPRIAIPGVDAMAGNMNRIFLLPSCFFR